MAFKKNTAVTGFTFGMITASDGSDFTSTVAVASSQDGGSFSSVGNATHIADGVHQINLGTSDMNGDIVCIKCTGTGAITRAFTIHTTTKLVSELNDFDASADTVAAVTAVSGTVTANVTQIDGNATSGNNATLNLAQLNIVNSSGSAIVASSTGSNGHGMLLSGNGSGDGLSTTGGGSSGHGVHAIAGAGGDSINASDINGTVTNVTAVGTVTTTTTVDNLGAAAVTDVVGACGSALEAADLDHLCKTTGGSIATGSILDQIISVGAGGTFNAATDSLEAIRNTFFDLRLDHLLSTSVTGTDVANNSVIAQMVSSSATADWDTFDNTTDSLQGAYDSIIATGNASWTTGAGGSAPTASEVADAVWDEDIVSAHGTDATAGFLLSILTQRGITWATSMGSTSVLSQMASTGTTFNRATDSLEAITNKGGSGPWTSGAAGAELTQAINWEPIIPNAIDLANTATWRMGIAITNLVDDLPNATEITQGTISIDRKAIGDTSWTSVLSNSAMNEGSGRVYYDEVFDSSSGYAEGDSIRVTFKSVSITADSNTFELVPSAGLMFYTHIRSTPLSGTVSANVVQISGDSTAADNAELFFDGTGYAGGTAKLDVNVVSVSGDTAAADNIEADYDGTGYNKTASEIGTVAVATVATTVTNDVSVAPASEASIVDAVWDESTTGHTTAGTFGQQLKTDVDAILVDTAAIATLQSTVNTVNTNLQASGIGADIDENDLATPLAVSATLGECVYSLYAALRNKIEVTDGSLIVYRDDGTTAAMTKTLTDDGSTYTEGEAS